MSCTCSQCAFVWALVFPFVFSFIKQTKYLFFLLAQLNDVIHFLIHPGSLFIACLIV